jgi:hypothetical protein
MKKTLIFIALAVVAVFLFVRVRKKQVLANKIYKPFNIKKAGVMPVKSPGNILVQLINGENVAKVILTASEGNSQFFSSEVFPPFAITEIAIPAMVSDFDVQATSIYHDGRGSGVLRTTFYAN